MNIYFYYYKKNHQGLKQIEQASASLFNLILIIKTCFGALFILF